MAITLQDELGRPTARKHASQGDPQQSPASSTKHQKHTKHMEAAAVHTRPVLLRSACLLLLCQRPCILQLPVPTAAAGTACADVLGGAWL
jgi:hypothetical protein